MQVRQVSLRLFRIILSQLHLEESRDRSLFWNAQRLRLKGTGHITLNPTRNMHLSLRQQCFSTFEILLLPVRGFSGVPNRLFHPTRFNLS